MTRSTSGAIRRHLLKRFSTWAIAGNMHLFYLARIMGTSVAQIDATYGPLMPDSEAYLRVCSTPSTSAKAAAAEAFTD